MATRQKTKRFYVYWGFIYYLDKEHPNYFRVFLGHSVYIVIVVVFCTTRYQLCFCGSYLQCTRTTPTTR